MMEGRRHWNSIFKVLKEEMSVKNSISRETTLQKWRQTKDIHRQILREGGAGRPASEEILKEVLWLQGNNA